MSAANSSDLSRFALNTATVKFVSFREAAEAAARAGFTAIGAWRDRVQEVGATEAAKILADNGLAVSSLSRAGFFTMQNPDRIHEAVSDNKRAIEEAATIGAKELVIVVGGLPANTRPGRPVDPAAGDAARDLVAARERVKERLHDLADDARAHGVRLALQPMHPMFAADHSCVTTLAEALDIAAQFPPEVVGVIADTYQIWWDPQLQAALERAGREGRLAAYQLSDWTLPLGEDPFHSRGFVGSGYIDFKTITEWVTASGYAGFIETKIFNPKVWASPADATTARVREDYRKYILPHL